MESEQTRLTPPFRWLKTNPNRWKRINPLMNTNITSLSSRVIINLRNYPLKSLSLRLRWDTLVDSMRFWKAVVISCLLSDIPDSGSGVAGPRSRRMRTLRSAQAHIMVAQRVHSGSALPVILLLDLSLLECRNTGSSAFLLMIRWTPERDEDHQNLCVRTFRSPSLFLRLSACLDLLHSIMFLS